MIRPSRFQLALALAALAHASAWVLRARAPVVVDATSPEAPPSFEVEISEGPTGNMEAPGAASTSQPRATARSSGSFGGVVSESTPATGPSTIESAAPMTSSSAPVVNVWNVDALTQNALGVGDTRTFAAARPRTDAEIAQDRVQRQIEDGLRDQELSGDPVSGPIVRALEDSTSRSLAPVNGSATFDAVISAGGVLVSIGTIGEPVGKPYWDDVAKNSATALVGQKLRTSKRGLVVRIEITSREQLPSGASGGVGGDVLSDGSGRPHAFDVHVLPTAPSTKDGWGRKAEFTPFGGTFDVSDIGAVKRRVIGAHVTAVRDL